jgi:two-component system, chemotaxis family, protein-glutamate methylesterase/glutaminase
MPIAEIWALLPDLDSRELPKSKPAPKDIMIEPKIAPRVLKDLPSLEVLGVQVAFNYPDCGAGLWEMAERQQLRYRCQTSHGVTFSI